MPGSRPSARVAARGASGAVGLGEATPLPGRSPDTAEDCAAAVAALRAALPLPLSPHTALDAAADLAAAVAPDAPAARFAIETALVDLVARTTGVAMARLLAAAPARRIAVNALVADPAEAAAAVARGVGTVKLKLHGGQGADLALARAVRAAIGGARLRVDGNLAWPPGELDARLAALAALGVEYVEEPAPGVAAAARAPLAAPLALDESLADPEREAWLDRALGSRAIAAVVLKPTLLGGLAACLELAARARGHGVDAVVTHTFDGPVALAAACELARAIGGPRAHGVDRHPLLAGVVPQLVGAIARDSGLAGLGIPPPPAARPAPEASP